VSDQVFFIVMASIVTSGWVLVRLFRSPLGEALARRLGSSVDGAPPQELDDLRGRVAELEERQDFAERMLLQQPDHARLGREASSQ
jgi:hypothetical protein